MSLKSDLDDYLLQNESRRSKFSLPFSTPSFLSRSSETTPSSNNTPSWFEEVQKDYCTLVSTLFKYTLNLDKFLFKMGGVNFFVFVVNNVNY